MTEAKKRKAVYDPVASAKWKAKNRERVQYINNRSAARRFIADQATAEDIVELKRLLEEREEALGATE